MNGEMLRDARSGIPLLLELLEGWERGTHSVEDVRRGAAALLGQGPVPRLPKSDPGAIAIEVAAHLLAAGEADGVDRRDIPAMLRFLQTPQGSEVMGWGEWFDYWDEREAADARAYGSGSVRSPIFETSPAKKLRRSGQGAVLSKSN